MCIALSGLYTFLLYKGAQKKYDLSKPIFMTLMGLRFLAVFLVMFLVLDPLIKSIQKEIRKPILTLAVDQSESIAQITSPEEREQFANSYAALKNELSQHYDVVEYAFGDGIATNPDSLAYNGKQTNFQPLFKTIGSSFSGDHYAGTIIFSDGRFNRGVNPLYSKTLPGQFLSTVLVGDTTQFPDVFLKEVRTNDIVFLGNDFPVTVGVGAENLQTQQLLLSISKNGKTVAEQKLNVGGGNQYVEHNFFLEAKTPGLQQYEVKIATFNGERIVQNNQQTFYIDVIDDQSKVLILAAAPHPDIRFLKSTLSQKKQYNVEVALADDFKGSFDAFNLVITHNLPNQNLNLFSQLLNSNIPYFAIVGPKTNLPLLNQSAAEVKIMTRGDQSNTVRAAYDKAFSLFQLENGSFEMFSEFPPLVAPFGEVRFLGIRCLNQQVGAVNSGIPLLGFEDGDRKSGWLLANGIWQWGLYEGALEREEKLSEELILKSVQYLILREEKKRLKLDFSPSYWENERITLRAEVYNKAYQRVNDQPAALVLENENNETFDYAFQPRGEQYFLDLGFLTPGKYSMAVSTTLDGETLSDSGSFVVKELSLESNVSYADQQLMYQLAERNNGKFYFANQLNQLQTDLINTEAATPISSITETYQSIISWKWLLAIALALFAVEWFLRKRFGAY